MHCIDYSFCYSTFYFIKNSTQDFFIMILSYAYLPTLFISKVIFVLKGFFEKKNQVSFILKKNAFLEEYLEVFSVSRFMKIAITTKLKEEITFFYFSVRKLCQKCVCFPQFIQLPKWILATMLDVLLSF